MFRIGKGSARGREGMRLSVLCPALMLGVLWASGCLNNECLEIGTCHERDGGEFYPLEIGAWWQFEVLEQTDDFAVPYIKTIYVQEQADVPYRSGTTAYRVLRVSHKGTAHRWQEVTDCGVVRHLDKKHDEKGNWSETSLFCPLKTRVDDCDEHDCSCTSWEEEYTTLEWAFDEDSNGDRDACENLAVDSARCEPLEAHPTGCTSTSTSTTKFWNVEDVNVLVSVAAGQWSTLAQTNYTQDGGEDPGPPKTFWWARGIGKVKGFGEFEDAEELNEFCLPSVDEEVSCEENLPSLDPADY